jgi:hypothetical protein
LLKLYSKFLGRTPRFGKIMTGDDILSSGVTHKRNAEDSIGGVKSLQDREKRSGEANSPTQDISRLLWNPKVHHHVQKSQSLVFVVSQMNPVHNFRPDLSKIHCNITC